MIENPRFWLAIILYFASAALFSGIKKHLTKKPSLLQILYLILMLTASIGLWFFAGLESYSLKESLNWVNLVCIFTGAFTGLSVYSFPLILILTFFISYKTQIPIAALLPEENKILGELTFYPSNKGNVSLSWKMDEEEHIVSLKGDKAGVLFVRKSLPSEYFFLQNKIQPQAILSESYPVSDLLQPDPDWYYSLSPREEIESSLYKYSYPAVKYYDTGFFTSFLYTVDKQHILVKRQ